MAWKRCSATVACEICKSDHWCGYAVEEDGTIGAWRCMRSNPFNVPDGYSILKVCDDGGIVYTLDAGRNGRRTKPPDRTRVPLADPSPPDYPDTKWRYMAERFHRDVNLSKLATSLHVRVQALEMLRT